MITDLVKNEHTFREKLEERVAWKKIMLEAAIRDTRTHPGVSIRDIAKELRMWLAPEEVEALIKELK